MEKTGILCPNGHAYFTRSPIGKYDVGCPLCSIERIEKELDALRKFLRINNISKNKTFEQVLLGRKYKRKHKQSIK